MTDIIEVIDDGTIVAVVEQAAAVVIEVPQDDALTVVEIHVPGPQGPGTSVDLSSPGPIGDDTPDTIRSTAIEIVATAPSSVVLTLGDVEVKASVESASIGIGMDPVDDVTVAVDSLHVTALTIGDDARLPVTASSYDPDIAGGMFTLSSASYGDLAIGPFGVEARYHKQGAGYTGTYFSFTGSSGVRSSWELRNDGDTFDAYSAYGYVSRGVVRASFTSRADGTHYDTRGAGIGGAPDGGVLQFLRHVGPSGPESRRRILTVRTVDEPVDLDSTLLLPFPAADPFIETVATREWVESKYDPVVVATPSSSGGVLTLDFAGKSRAVFAVTLTENVTSVLHTNVPTDVFLEKEIHYTQGGAGTYTVAQPASHKALGGSDTVVSTTVGKVTVQSASSVDGGTTWRYAMQESA